MRIHEFCLKRSSFFSVVLVLGFMFVAEPGPIARAQGNQGCAVAIGTLHAGDHVGANEQVEGTARNLNGKFLWIFAHRTGFALWWPQGGGPATVDDAGHWAITTSFGVDADMGRDFEVAAVVVDSGVNANILKYIERTLNTGLYPGMQFPAVDTGCGIHRVTVTRTN